MPKLLLTAYEPFGNWKTNSSQLCLEQVLPLLDSKWVVTARIYPVEFELARPLLETDLQQGFDFTIHLGQTQQTARIRLEAVGLNIGAVPGKPEGESFCLIPGAPAAYLCPLPLVEWAGKLRAAGIPAYVSFHAGTYLCNATLYWCQHTIQQRQLSTHSCFVHVPLDLSQVTELAGDYYTLPTSIVAQSIVRVAEMWYEGQVSRVQLA